MIEIPDFDAAVAEFQDFLASRALGADLIWVFREDVVAWRRNIRLRWPLPADNPSLARRYYERGRQIGIGVQLQAWYRVGDKVCCCVNPAENEADASHQMLYGLKLSILDELVQAQPVTRPWQWRLLSAFQAVRGGDWLMSSLPSRRII